MKLKTKKQELDYAMFEVVNLDGEVEASTEGARAQALAEALHYAKVYEKDAPVTVFEVFRAPVSRKGV